MKLKLKTICEYLLYIFVFLIPWQTRYIFKYLNFQQKFFEYGKLSFYLNEVFLLLFMFLVIIYFSNQENESKFSFSKITKAIVLFLLVVFIGFFRALNKQFYIYAFLKLLELVSFYILLIRFKFNYLYLKLSFVFSMLIHAVLGIYQFFIQTVFANKYLGIAQQIPKQAGVSVIEFISHRILRVYGGLSHPNIFGGFLVIAILFLISIFLEKKKKIVLFLGALIILFTALIFTFSRSAFLALFLSLFSLLVYSFFQKKYFKKIILLISVLLIFFSFYFIIFNKLFEIRIQQKARLELKSQTERIILKKQALSLLEKNWFLGVGLNNYLSAVYKNINSNLNIWDYQPVHNVYLLVFTELGIVGFIIYLSIYIFSFIRVLSLKSVDNFILALILLSILIINFFDHYFWTYWSALILSFLIFALINKIVSTK